MKTCISCGESKSFDQFGKHTTKDGYRTQCKRCIAARNKAWRDANRDVLLEKKKIYYQENKEAVAERNRQWAQTDQAKSYRKRYYQENKDRLTYAGILKRYGITMEQYDEMYEAQGGKCSICREVCISGRKLAVDHCHITGENRSLLCLNCNQGLGKFKDNPELLRAALRYLRKHQKRSGQAS